MKPYFYFVLSILIGLYTMLNYYIGIRLMKIIISWYPSIHLTMYWILFYLVAFLYIISRFLKDYVPLTIAKLTTSVGAYYLAVMFYLVIIFVMVDMVLLTFKLLGYVKGPILDTYTHLKLIGIISLGILFVLLIYGSIVARNPKITNYDITLPKMDGKFDELTAVLISDIHLGKIIDNSRLNKLVEMVREIEPDIIFIAGDIVDEDIRPFTKEKMYETFGKLKPKLGIYACLGNHDYIGGHVNDIVKYLEGAGIHVLVDEYMLVADSFYIAGRNDPTGARISKKTRKKLNKWLVDLDEKLPVILLDHQPKEIAEAVSIGVDLLLCGHTHLGQMFPNMFITSVMYDNDYGYSKVRNTHVIVSSGYGTWGPPIRVGTRGEVVTINIKFRD